MITSRGKETCNEQFRFLSCMIGATPMLEIKCLYRGEERLIYVKAEHYNLTGSIKDRMALHILEKAYENGAIDPRARIIEATSGNTGIAFAAIGRALGHPVTIFMPDWMSLERINLIKSFGADIELVSHEDGGFLGALKIQNQLSSQSVVVTVFSDDNKKYLSTDLMKEEPEKDEFISKDVELISYKARRCICCRTFSMQIENYSPADFLCIEDIHEKISENLIHRIKL